MNSGTKKMMGAAKIQVTTGVSRYGNPEPQIELRAPKGTPHRQVRAALFALAAEVELETPQHEGWIVQIDPLSDESGRVYLELMNCEEPEVARGLDLLRRICQ